MLTARDDRASRLEGFRAGADDYVSKPFDSDELRARILVGLRIAETERVLTAHVAELRDALERNRSLSGLLPLCAWCRKIRDNDGYWKQVETYITENTDARFTHGICEACAETLETQQDDSSAGAAAEEPPLAQEPGCAPLSGCLRTLSLADLLQAFHHSMRSGRLTLTRVNGEVASVYLKDGEVRQARTDELAGEDAVFHALQWEDGDFTFDEGETAPAPNVLRSTMGLLMEGMRRIDEARHQQSSCPVSSAQEWRLS
jgi:CheY-like chemotaxis protein